MKQNIKETNHQLQLQLNRQCRWILSDNNMLINKTHELISTDFNGLLMSFGKKFEANTQGRAKKMQL